MKKAKMISWAIGFILFCGWADLVWGQTPTIPKTQVEITDKTLSQQYLKGL